MTINHRKALRDTGNIVVASLDDRWRKYRAQLKTCRREFSETAVHDLRVAARRLLAALEIAGALDPHPRIRKARRGLKSRLGGLNELRDIQVLLADIREAAPESPPGLKLFEMHLSDREKSLLRSARKQLTAAKSSKLGNRVGRICKTLEEQPQDAGFDARLLRTVNVAYRKAVRDYGRLDALQPETVHRLRVAFKKFRYMVEVVHPILPGYPRPHLKNMREYQNAMGSIQDVKIFFDALDNFAGRNAFFDARPARRFYEKRRAGLIARYLQNKEAINNFWRAAPGLPFPWRKKRGYNVAINLGKSCS